MVKEIHITFDDKEFTKLVNKKIKNKKTWKQCIIDGVKDEF